MLVAELPTITLSSIVIGCVPAASMPPPCARASPPAFAATVLPVIRVPLIVATPGSKTSIPPESRKTPAGPMPVRRLFAIVLVVTVSVPSSSIPPPKAIRSPSVLAARTLFWLIVESAIVTFVEGSPPILMPPP